MLREVLKDKQRFIEIMRSGKDAVHSGSEHSDDSDSTLGEIKEGTQGDLFRRE